MTTVSEGFQISPTDFILSIQKMQNNAIGDMLLASNPKFPIGLSEDAIDKLKKFYISNAEFAPQLANKLQNVLIDSITVFNQAAASSSSIMSSLSADDLTILGPLNLPSTLEIPKWPPEGTDEAVKAKLASVAADAVAADAVAAQALTAANAAEVIRLRAEKDLVKANSTGDPVAKKKAATAATTATNTATIAKKKANTAVNNSNTTKTNADKKIAKVKK
jgi:hypothetical protein